MGLIQTSGKKLTDSSGTSITYNAAGNFTAGNSVVIALTHWGGGSRVSAISVNGTAAVKGAEKYDSPTQNAQEIWCASNVAGGGSGVVLTVPSGSYVVCSFEEWDNIALSSPLDQTGTGGVTTSNAPSFTTGGATSQADEVAYAVFGDTGSAANWSSATPPSGWTETFEEVDGINHEAGSAAYKVLSATGSVTATFGAGASIPWSGCIATFKQSSGGGDVTVGATGQSAAANAGTLTQSRTVALAGSAVAASAGTMSAASAVTAALSGQSSTSAAGTVVQSRVVALSGSSVAASAGTVSASSDVTAALSGSAVTASAGTLAPARSTAVAGLSESFGSGSVTTARSVALAGAAPAAAAGTLAPSRVVALSGSAVAASAGTLGVSLDGSLTLALSGEQIIVSAGTLAVACSKAIGGQAAAASAGTLAPTAALGLTSVSVTSAAGGFTVTVAGAMTGAQALALAGTLSADGDPVAVMREVVRLTSAIATARSADSHITTARSAASAIALEDSP